MATRRITQYVDDLDGTELAGEGRNVRFSLNGRDYEIDLGEANEQKLVGALKPFTDAARPVKGLAGSSRGAGRRAPSGIKLP